MPGFSFSVGVIEAVNVAVEVEVKVFVAVGV